MSNNGNRMSGNKGEWSELYAFMKLLSQGRVYAANEKVEKIDEVYYPILKIMREETRGEVIDYVIISTHSLTRRLTAILFNKNRFVQFIFITLYQSPPQPLLLPPFFHPIFSFSARISGANRPRIGWGLGVRTIGSGYR